MSTPEPIQGSESGALSEPERQAHNEASLRRSLVLRDLASGQDHSIETVHPDDRRWFTTVPRELWKRREV